MAALVTNSAAAMLQRHRDRLRVSASSASMNQLQHFSSPSGACSHRRCAANSAAAPPQMWTAKRSGGSRLACAAAPLQEAESPTASRDGDADVQLELPAASPRTRQLSGNGAPRSPMMTTLEQNDSIEALESVQSKEAIIEDRGEWVFTLVGAAIAFGAGVWAFMGPESGAEYFAGYLLEQSLSVDNLFVFILVFNYLKVPRDDQNKVLTYGLLSAAVLRAVMILGGAALIENFEPVLLAFAGVLLFSSFKLLTAEDEDEDEDLTDNFIVKFCRRFIPVSTEYDGDRFFTIENGQKIATPLLLALAVVELSDVVFAVDSVPAVFGVTKDPFIIYSSNVFAIISLRALYSFVASIMSELRFLNKAVALVLGFVGAKMVAEFGGFGISTQLSLAVVASLLTGGVGLSLLLPLETLEELSSPKDD